MNDNPSRGPSVRAARHGTCGGAPDNPPCGEPGSSSRVSGKQPIVAAGTRQESLTIVAAAALLGGLSYGFCLAVIAGAEPFIAEQFDLSNRELGLVVSNLDLGAALGALLSGPWADRLGRRKVILATAALFLASAILTTIATTVALLLCGRLLAGLGVGALMILPLYVAEISPPKRRAPGGARANRHRLRNPAGLLHELARGGCGE